MCVEHHIHTKASTVQDPDRWCSHSPCGQEAWQIVCQWVSPLRLELGHHLEPTPLRTTEFAPAIAQETERTAPCSGYAVPEVALPWKAGRFSGQDFVQEPDGTLRCPEGKSLRPTELRRERDGTLRVLYAARMRDCRSCRLREQCQWHGTATTKPRRVSVLLHPLKVGSAPLLWRDWSRRQHRRVCMQLLRGQRVDVPLEPASQVQPETHAPLLSRAQRARRSTLVGRAPGSQCACANRGPDQNQTLRRDIRLYHVPRPPHKLTSPDRWWSAPFSEKVLLFSPSGASWLLCLTFPLFLSSVARLVPSLAVSVSSPERILQLRAAFIPDQSMNSSITSLRNSWANSALRTPLFLQSCDFEVALPTVAAPHQRLLRWL
jgi:hypothetical protein